MRLRGKIDGNQALIVRALRQAGISVQSLSNEGDGCPDLLCGIGGINVLLEVKPIESTNRKRLELTPAEKIWHDNWRGQVAVVNSVEEALKIVAGAGGR